MGQSSTIGFALIAGFVVYITVRGELPAYLCVVGIGNNCVQPNPQVQPQQTKPDPNQPPQNQPGKTPPTFPSAPGGSGGNDPGYPTSIVTPPWGVYSGIELPGGYNGPELPLPAAPGWELPPVEAPPFPEPPVSVDSTITYGGGFDGWDWLADFPAGS